MSLSYREMRGICDVLDVRLTEGRNEFVGHLHLSEYECIQIHFPRGVAEFGDQFMNRFRGHLHLSPKEFARLRDGAMTREEYLSIVRPRLGVDVRGE